MPFGAFPAAKRQTGEKSPSTAWRYYFKEVQAPALGKVRKECRRHLEEAESTILSGK
jgi:hypothetical protein